MSNQAGVALIAALVVASYAAVLFADKWLHNRGEAVASGNQAGATIPLKQRWLILTNTWLPNVVGLILFCLIDAAVFVWIGQNVDDSFLTNLAYICAVWTTWASVFWLILGGSWLVYYVSVLRQAEAD